MNLPPEISTALLAALPLTELRAAIPLAIGLYKMSSVSALSWALIGNCLAALAVIWLIGPVTALAGIYLPWLKRLLDWIFVRTRNQNLDKYLKYGQWALVIFVAIPLPGTGAWTGALIAFLFGLTKWKSWLLICLGVLIAGVLVTLITQGIIQGFNFILDLPMN